MLFIAKAPGATLVVLAGLGTDFAAVLQLWRLELLFPQLLEQ
jgi:hypothetical protein